MNLRWIASALVLLAPLAAAQETPMPQKIVGMYVHQHWSYNHPYAARTWTLDDWRGYLDALHKVGYNTVLIWPVLETMPEPLTDSDRESLAKIAKVIDTAHREHNMRVFITLCPNVAPKDAEAAKYTFEQRPFFYCDYRVDPADAVALGRLVDRREKLFRELAAADGVAIIDSDPGGYPGSNNVEFAYLLGAHRKMLDRVRPGMELFYWIHVGWESYCRYYLTGEFAMGEQAEVEDAISLLARLKPEPWGIASGRGAGVADALNMRDRVMTFSYGAIEGEPSFPRINFGGESAFKAGHDGGARGTMGNAQTHCVQLPNTFAFARGAQGLPVADADYVRFADDLIPGQGALIVDAWKSIAGDGANANAIADALGALPADALKPGPLRGFLFGDVRRFVDDLILQLRLNAALYRFHEAAMAPATDRARAADALEAFVSAAEQWQGRHGYKNNWGWSNLDEALRKLNIPEINAALENRNYLGEGDTPFERIQSGFYKVETYTPTLLKAMRNAVGTLRMP
ncbi:MAG: hypothetical protein RBU21_03605 [FCB group bacterium]|nr:hypothetical protein [FCB group bacterium]